MVYSSDEDRLRKPDNGSPVKELPPKPSGKRGKITKSDAHNLWERLKFHEAAILLFANDPHVAFTK